MKIEIKQKNESKPRPFPKLMVSLIDGAIILMHSPGKGTQLNLTKSGIIGIYFDEWVMTHFKDFDGEVVLSNE